MRSLLVLILCFFILSCNQSTNAPDVEKVEIPMKRFEKSFFSIDTANLLPGFQKLSTEYPRFFPYFMNGILHIPARMEGDSLEPQAAYAYRQIISSYRPIYDSIMLKYKDLDDTKEAIEQAYAYVKHYYPQYNIPELISFIATFDAPGIILTPDYLGIGLHQFAGKNFSVYQDPQLIEMYPVYISRRFDKEYIPSAAMKAVADDIYPDSSAGGQLIEQMIEKGKQWWLVKHFLPKTNDTLITGFSKKQLDWVTENEGNVWGYITANHDIYTIDPTIIQDFIGEGPFTRGMPETHSPGNIGQWVGLRILQAFVDKNDKLSVQQVLQTPAATIFQESKYKPR